MTRIRAALSCVALVGALALVGCASASPAPAEPSASSSDAGATAPDADAVGPVEDITFDTEIPSDLTLKVVTDFDTDADFRIERDEPGSILVTHIPTGSTISVVDGPWEQYHADVFDDSLAMISGIAEADMSQEKTQTIELSYDPFDAWTGGEQGDYAMEFVMAGSKADDGGIATIAARTLPSIDTATFVQFIVPSRDVFDEVANAAAAHISYTFE